MPSSGLKNLGGFKSPIDISGNPGGQTNTSSILSKPMLSSGGKATLPTSIKKFQLKPR